ncbi:hypothetical protein RN001_009047 [Aquatica leii]|uniref:Metalloendopeptidase n=1 Tax=Aquatica leii TaxID=1421715 RepID=A0AAN7S800_9COLE|nr:hypothetical protein RN001_009047 [Aquatica leii]
MKRMLLGVFAVLAAVQVQSNPVYTNAHDWINSGKFEGDMVLTDAQRNGDRNETLRWTNRVIPYELWSGYTAAEKAFIKNSLNAFNQTCLKIRERVSTDINYVYITGENNSCWSWVGMLGGAQQLNLNKICCCQRSATVVHEFLHAIGFHHMQSNYNRDDYLIVHYENIEPGAEYNFDKKTINQVNDFGLRYDYDSIMHYPRKAFSKNNRDTIEPKDPTAVIGEAKKMSDIDIAKVLKMYKC